MISAGRGKVRGFPHHRSEMAASDRTAGGSSGETVPGGVPTHTGGERLLWGRRVLLGFCLGMLVLLLLVDGFTTKTVGAAGTGARSVAGSPLAGSPPVRVSNGHRGVASHQPPPGRRIALTFDDGPSPEWTPKIAAILRAQHVPATVFVVGS